MRKLLVLSAVLAIAAGCKKKEEKKDPPPPLPAAASDAAPGATAEQQADGDPKLIERGAYLANTAACLVCHTAMGPQGPDFANVGAGGLEMEEKFGTWRSPNITPDKSTGIGSWTDEQVIVAVREGIRPDGTKLNPMMPYMNYNVMTDDDAKALVAFLKTLKPVERTVAKSDVKLEPIPVGKPPNEAPGDDPMKQGAYVASLMLCNHCHWTPNKEFTAPASPDKMFSGGLPFELPPMGKGVLYGANITSDPDTGIGKWTEEQIFTSLKTMQRPDGRMIQGPMLFMQSVWSQLPEQDLKNVALFIKKLPPVKNKVPKSTFVPHGPPPGAGAGGAGGPPGAGVPPGAGSPPGAAGAPGAAGPPGGAPGAGE
jgi:cytochrome c553